MHNEENNIKQRRGRKPKQTPREERPDISLEKMRAIVSNFKEISTPRGIRYINLRFTKKMIIGIRESSGKEFTINIEELYHAYNQCHRFTSPEVKKYIFMGHSPALAFLRAIKDTKTQM